MAKREIKGVGVVKHDAPDYITDERKLGIYCKFFDKDQKVIISDNLNFVMKPEKFNELKAALGIKNFSTKTPIRLRMSIDEADLNKWADDANVELGDPQDKIDSK